MKIARTPDFSEYPDEWERLNILRFVGAMKIARNVAVSGRLDEWYGPFPAPSLRELSRPTGVTEGVSPDEWERLNILSFVGAMKIARNLGF